MRSMKDMLKPRRLALKASRNHYLPSPFHLPPLTPPTSLQPYPKVLIAAVHGAAIGWGCTQLSNFDLVYAHPQSFFQTPFMSLGFSPEDQSSYTFPKTMGKQHANRLLLGAEKVSARDMYV